MKMSSPVSTLPSISQASISFSIIVNQNKLFDLPHKLSLKNLLLFKHCTSKKDLSCAQLSRHDLPYNTLSLVFIVFMLFE